MFILCSEDAFDTRTVLQSTDQTRATRMSMSGRVGGAAFNSGGSSGRRVRSPGGRISFLDTSGIGEGLS